MRVGGHRGTLRRVVGAGMALFAVLITGAYLSVHVYATQGASWINGAPVLTEEIEYRKGQYGANEARKCASISMQIAGSITPQQRCVTPGDNTFIDDRLEYIKVGSDQKYYRMQGVYSSYSSVRRTHVPLTNTLVTRSGYTMFTYSATLSIEKNILSSLTPTDNPPGPRQYEYEHRPDFILSDSNGPLPVAHGLAYSDNGRWLVVELMGIGLARIDLQNNYKAELVSTLAPGYYVGSNPSMILAISDDGRSVAVGGGNTPFVLFEVDESCVMQIRQDEPLNRAGYSGCPGVGLAELTGLTAQYQYPRGLEFGDSSYELRYYADGGAAELCGADPEWEGCEAWRTIRAAGYTPSVPQLDYLALGDSYASGEGDTERDKRTNKKYYRLGTDVEEDKAWDQPREKCHISTRSYPYILSKGMPLGDPLNNSSTKWQSVACSGARISDINDNNSDSYKGQGKGSSKLWDDGSIPRLEGYNVDALKTTALNEFIPGRQKQIEFVKMYKPKVITLTIGGNDLGFGEKLASCITPGTCRIASGEGKADFAKEIRDQYDNLKPFYEKLYEESGNTARIFVLGYPQFISGTAGASCGVNTKFLDDNERKAIKAGVTYFNNVIEQAAKAAGVKYIDIEDSLQGGRLCDESQAYMTGISTLGGNEFQESFHPNAKGHHRIAMQVWDQVHNESLLEYSICPDTVIENRCDDTTATKEAIIIPPYFQVTEPGYSIEYASDMTSGSVAKGVPLNVIRSVYSFEPGSVVEFTLFSDPVELGDYIAGSDGSLDAQVQIPNSIPVGYHTLVADGVTYSGEPIRYEQIILVRGADPNDIDEDGAPDEQQACGPFMIASGVDADLDGVDDACDPEISEAPELYKWRFGYSERIYNGNPEDESQIYIERNIWAGSATGVVNDYDPDGDGWAIVGMSQGSQLDGASAENADTMIDFEVLGEGAPDKPYYPVIYVRPGSEQCKAYQPANLGQVRPEELRTLSIAEISNDKCPQELPGDGDPQELEDPPRNESLVDRLRDSLSTIKVKITNLINAVLVNLRILLTPLRR